MPKIKLKTTGIQDSRIFELVYTHVELKIVDFAELFQVDEYIPLVNIHQIVSLNLGATIRNYLASGGRHVIYVELAEGTYGAYNVIKSQKLWHCSENKQIAFIISGDLPDSWLYANLDSYMEIIASDYNQIVSLNRHEEIYNKLDKPYDFLFLNRNPRQHRQYLIENLNLEHALWSNVSQGRMLPIEYDDPFNYDKDYKILETSYGTYAAKSNPTGGFWPDGLLVPEIYIDTYFSLVTETCFDHKHTNFSEKIWKPLLMGHPFIAASTPYFYKRLHEWGFKTFDSLIDESFDDIENDDTRLASITNTVNDLVKQDLNQFITSARDICLYNRQHYMELLGQHKHYKYNKLIELLGKLC